MANRVGSPSAVSPFCMLAYTYGKLQLTNGPVNTFFRPLTPLAHGPFVRSPSLLPFHAFCRLALPHSCSLGGSGSHARILAALHAARWGFLRPLPQTSRKHRQRRQCFHQHVGALYWRPRAGAASEGHRAPG